MLKSTLACLLAMFIIVFFPGCDDGESGAVPTDGDSETTNPDTDFDPLDGDIEFPDDGDIDVQPDGDEDLEIEDELDDTVADRDEEDIELIRPDVDEETDGDSDDACPNGPDAICFTHGTPGQSGTMCSGNILLFCEPTVPTPPICASSFCQCSQMNTCDEGCIDATETGSARCEGDTDGDISDGDEEDDIDSESDGDADGDATDGDDDNVTDGDDEPDIDQGFVCTRDVYEPNESLGQAAGLEPGYYTGLTLCTNDKDYFAVDLLAGDEMSATITFDNDLRNLDMILFGPDFQIIQRSESESADREEVFVSADTDGTYYLWVRSGSAGEAPYNLMIDVLEYLDGDEEIEPEPEPEEEEEVGPICEDDDLEENDSFATAVPVSTIAYTDLVVCPDESDFYSLSPRVGDWIEIEIDFIHDDGNLDLFLFDSTGTMRLNSVTSSSAVNRERFSFSASDTYYVFQVKGKFGASNSYDMTITLLPSTQCVDDSYEGTSGNNTHLTAAELPANGDTDLKLCPYDPDVYRIDMNANQGLRVDVSFIHAIGNIDARLVNSMNETVYTGDTITDNETLYYNSISNETVYLEVYTITALELSYDVEIMIQDGPICQDDEFEPNNAFGEEFVMDYVNYLPDKFGRFEDLKMCPNDSDWFKFTLARRDLISTKVLYDSDIVDLHLTLFNETENEVAYFTDITGGREMKKQVDVAGDYSLRIRPLAQIETDYTMIVDICTEDIEEDNDDKYHAIDMSSSISFQNLAICGDDEDWWHTTLVDGQSCQFTINFNADRGELDFIAKDGDGIPVAPTQGSGGQRYVTYTADRPFVDVYFQVFRVGDTSNRYSITFTKQ